MTDESNTPKKKTVTTFEAEIAGIQTLRDLNKYIIEVKPDIAKLIKKDNDKVSAFLRKKREEVPHIERVEIREFLRHNLTPDELKDISGEMAQAHIDLETAEADKKASNSQYDGIIKNSKLTVSQRSRTFRDGYEMRNIDCEKVKDFHNKTVTTVRTDTPEIVKERPMTVDEMQMSLPADLI